MPSSTHARTNTGAGALIAITLKRAYADGTVAVEMDPLFLVCRLAMSVPTSDVADLERLVYEGNRQKKRSAGSGFSRRRRVPQGTHTSRVR